MKLSFKLCIDEKLQRENMPSTKYIFYTVKPMLLKELLIDIYGLSLHIIVDSMMHVVNNR